MSCIRPWEKLVFFFFLGEIELNYIKNATAGSQCLVLVLILDHDHSVL